MFSCSLTPAIVFGAVKNNVYLCILKSLLFVNSVIKKYADYVNYMNTKNTDSSCKQRLETTIQRNVESKDLTATDFD